ncbi:hypothetical protein L596_021594 [Steinernema carpocapsae]|uniref:SEA domain-containing protein n=1 Tax=Steinernema carpocapsae TaxID=34508 RepID=A0A4U5MJA7_STECR|nr:hypothetical protein L596_021594 [Steinernema carpocapsae]
MQSVLQTTFRSLFTSFVTILLLLQFSISRADTDSDLSNEVLEYNIHDHSKEQTYDIKVRGSFRTYKAFEEAKLKLQSQTFDWCALGIKLLEEEINKFWSEEDNQELQKLLRDSDCFDRKKKGLYAYERPDQDYQEAETRRNKEPLNGIAIALIVAVIVVAVLTLGVFIWYSMKETNCGECCRGSPKRNPHCDIEAPKSVESTQEQPWIDAEVPFQGGIAEQPRKPFKRDFTDIGGSCCCDADWDAHMQDYQDMEMRCDKSTMKACSETTELKSSSSWITKKFPSRSIPTQQSEKSVTPRKLSSQSRSSRMRGAKKKKNPKRKVESMDTERPMSSRKSKKSTREASEAQLTEKTMSSGSFTAQESCSEWSDIYP